MLRIKIIFTSLFLFLSFLIKQEALASLPGYQPVASQVILPIEMVNLQGKSISLQSFKGKFLILNFWETYCPYCVDEFKSLDNLAQRFKDKIAVVAVSSNPQTKNHIHQIIKTQQLAAIQFHIISRNLNKVNDFYKVASLPTTYIINPKGEMIGVLRQGLQWDSLGSLDFIQNLIENWDVNASSKTLLIAQND